MLLVLSIYVTELQVYGEDNGYIRFKNQELFGLRVCRSKVQTDPSFGTSLHDCMQVGSRGGGAGGGWGVGCTCIV